MKVKKVQRTLKSIDFDCMDEKRDFFLFYRINEVIQVQQMMTEHIWVN